LRPGAGGWRICGFCASLWCLSVATPTFDHDTMTLRLYNTLRRAAVPFEPLDPPTVRMYACGPTTYDFAHVGNYRSFVVYDLLRRYLMWLGFDVRFVMNLTDVDDKVIDGAAKAGLDIRDFTAPFGEAILRDADTLGILPADSYPVATQHIEGMVDWVRRLEEKGLAYAADDGSVYFRIAGFATYGDLKGLDPDSLKTGARVEADDYEKDDARDFALWKAAKPVDAEVGAAWDSPWGKGRPGWHLECSVMSIAELGETLDIHLGGEDLIFPHHENEIAQSEGVTGRPFVRFWVHVKHLVLEGVKMSKSLGNTVTVRELLDEGVEPAAIRHELMSAQYRRELNFTRDGLAASASAVQRLVDFHARLEELTPTEGAEDTRLSSLAGAALSRFQAALDDDLNSAEALAALFVFVKEVNAELDSAAQVNAGDRRAVLDAIESIDRVLGLISLALAGRTVDENMAVWADALVAERDQARRDKDFARADAIRDELAAKGLVLEDSAEGTRWKIVR
jgi:cysteinyl-tRNA synthetase